MKYIILIRWKNAAGNGDHETVKVEAKSLHDAKEKAVNEIISKYPNVYEPKAVD